jgi:hypothetical protein
MFEPDYYKNFCPECGDKKIEKIRVGSFRCGECGCEFRHNYMKWLLVATPSFLLLFLLLIEVSQLRSVPKWLFCVLTGVAVLVVLVSGDWYSIGKHGREFNATEDENPAA